MHVKLESRNNKNTKKASIKSTIAIGKRIDIANVWREKMSKFIIRGVSRESRRGYRLSREGGLLIKRGSKNSSTKPKT